MKFLVAEVDIAHTMETQNDDDWEGNHESLPPGWRIRRNKGIDQSEHSISPRMTVLTNHIADSRKIEILSPENICFPRY